MSSINLRYFHVGNLLFKESLFVREPLREKTKDRSRKKIRSNFNMDPNHNEGPDSDPDEGIEVYDDDDSNEVPAGMYLVD